MLAALCAVLCVSTAQASADAQFALIRANAKGEIRLYSAKPIVGEVTVLTQYPGPDDRPRCCKRLSAAEFHRVAEPETIATDEATDEPLHVYLGQLPAGWPRHPFVGAAAVGTTVQMKEDGERLEMKEDGRATLVATLCTSQEGLHLKAGAQGAVEGKGQMAKAGKAVHLYLWMGDGIANPTCRP